jgi:hypothetical protein
VTIPAPMGTVICPEIMLIERVEYGRVAGRYAPGVRMG